MEKFPHRHSPLEKFPQRHCLRETPTHRGVIRLLDLAMDRLGCDAAIAKNPQYSKRRSRRNRHDANMKYLKGEDRPDGYPPHCTALDQRETSINCNDVV